LEDCVQNALALAYTRLSNAPGREDSLPLVVVVVVAVAADVFVVCAKRLALALPGPALPSLAAQSFSAMIDLGLLVLVRI
jgi:hypothetical protein